MGETRAVFHSLGSSPEVRDTLNSLVTAGVILRFSHSHSQTLLYKCCLLYKIELDTVLVVMVMKIIIQTACIII